MVRKELMSYVGSAQQLMAVRPVVYKEGRAEGLQAYEVKNDRLSFSVMIDKCLDIAEVNWKGYNISFYLNLGSQEEIIMILMVQRHSAVSWEECYSPVVWKIFVHRVW